MGQLNKYDIVEQEYQALWSEYLRLMSASRNLGYIKLEKPIRSGWHKHLILRDDISRRKDADIIQEVLDIAGTKIWGRDQKHADKVWNKTNRKNPEIQFPGVKRIPKWDFDKLSANAKKWFKPFDIKYSYFHGAYKRYYCIVPRFYFKIAYSKAYITHRKIIDPLLEQRMDEIDQKFHTSKFINLHRKGWGRYNWVDKDFVHKRNRRKIKMELNAFDEEKFSRRDIDKYTIKGW